jgi:hypothetical protein
MSNSRNWFKIGGLVLHVLIAALMILASSVAPQAPHTSPSLGS